MLALSPPFLLYQANTGSPLSLLFSNHFTKGLDANLSSMEKAKFVTLIHAREKRNEKDLFRELH